MCNIFTLGLTPFGITVIKNLLTKHKKGDMSMSKNVTAIDLVINSYEPEFQDVVATNAISFKQESLFAYQQLTKGRKKNKRTGEFEDSFTMTTAKRNPESLKLAIMNVASIGVSLSPAKKQAYLVPRNGEVVLDVSYMGLCHLAQESGALKWVQSDIVRKKDRFLNNGKFEKPTHEYDAFGDRGEIIGVYCVAYTGADYLVETMPILEVYKIRDKSDGYDKNPQYSPWTTFPEEMIKKTVVKRAAKMWPVVEDSRLANAIEHVNRYQGINFDNQEEEEITHSSQETLKEIRDLLKIMGKDEGRFCAHLENIVDGCPSNLERLTDLTEKHAIYALEALQDIYNKYKNITPTEPKVEEDVKKEDQDKPVFTNEDIEF